ncbi:hypothetical protein [Pedobacter sp. JY14-1]|uniref:hypothetical protein n=1 Tax=Pedobacter sp. JY14-1 TaxID=3034151 RepID=UPI0023E0BCC7|nr:hypothetical protein [Pedobacter sp. JY14-1]
MLYEYKKDVFLAYQAKKKKGLLSTNLTAPTPGKLKDECVLVYKERFLEKDEEFIKRFFNSGVKCEDYSRKIQKHPTDKFRPLVTYLKNRTGSTEDRNIEMLAWLIDFENRPYNFLDYATNAGRVDGGSVGGQKDNGDLTNDIGQKGTTEPGNISTSGQELSWRKIGITISELVSVLVLLCMLFISFKPVYICNGSSAKRYHKNRNCPSLRNCGGTVEKVSESNAKKNGKTLCLFDVE